MATEEATLREFETLLMEMFSGRCSNSRMREIDKLLEDFSCRSDAWRYCLYFLHNSQNPNVQMYSLNVLEKFITRLWPSMTKAHRLQVRHTTWVFLDQHPSVPSFIRNKVIKVIVSMARLEWPLEYPEFFQTVYQLIKQDSTSSIGLTFLLTASEELITPREDLITTSRRKELREHLLQEAHSIVPLLLEVLRLQAQRHQCTVHPTPPSSPAPNLPHHRQPALKQQINKTPSFTPFDATAEEICSLCLRCLSHMFGWIPLGVFVTPSVTETLFYYVFLGCESENDCTDSAGTLGHLALGCVNEILQRNFVPNEADNFMVQLFERTFILLRKLTGWRGIDTLQTHYASLDDRYLEKCNEYLRLLMSSHLRRIEANPHFPVSQFLSLYQEHTLKQPQMDSYYLCLEAWNVFLDHVITTCAESQAGRTPPEGTHQMKYKEPLLNLMDGLLKKMLMDFNLVELSELDDDRLDSDNETEWQCFIRQTAEVFAQIAELFPVEAFQKLVPLLETYSATYFKTKDYLVREGNALYMNLGSVDQEGLLAVLRDLSTTLQILGRLAEHLSGVHFVQRLESARLLFNRFSCVAKYSSDQELHSIMLPDADDSSENVEGFDHVFIEVHAHALGALKAMCYDWLPAYYLCAVRSDGRECGDCGALVESLCELGFPLLVGQIPERISVAAGQMLLTLTHAVRPRQLTQLQIVQDFIMHGLKGTFNQLPNLIRRLSYRIVSNIFVIPWPEVASSQQHWESRSHEFSKFLDGAMHEFLELHKIERFGERPEMLVQAGPLVQKALGVLEDIVVGISSEGSKSKNVMFSSMKKFVELSVALFPHYLTNPGVLESMMTFFHTVFKCLKVQVGSALTQATMGTIMKLLERDMFQKMLLSNDAVCCNVMQKFLSMLNDQVSGPGLVAKLVLSNIITFCLEVVYATVEKISTPDVKMELYKLFTQILTHNWRFFFPSNVLVHMEGEEDKEMTNVEQFVAIMDTYLQSFLQAEIELFRENLNSLQELNRRHKLFSKAIFKDGMLSLFVQVLLEVLVQKSHDLLREEIGTCLHSMANCSFDQFHSDILPAFLCKFQQLSQDQRDKLASNYKMDKDLPSFLSNIHQFSGDLRYYILLNSAVPQGSVQLTGNT